MIYISNLRKFSDRIVTTKINWFFVHFSSYFAGLIPKKIRIKLCLADSGISRSAFHLWAVKTSAVRDGAPWVYSYPLHAVDRTLVGLMGPPFQLITLSDHLLFYSFFKKQTLYNFVAQRTVATNLIVSSSKQKNIRSLRCHFYQGSFIAFSSRH